MFPKYTKPYIWFDSSQDGIAIPELNLVQFDFFDNLSILSICVTLQMVVVRDENSGARRIMHILPLRMKKH